MRSKAWYTPMWLMVGLLLLRIVGQLATFTITPAGSMQSGKVFLALWLWPSVILIDAIVYWMIRKGMYERKWVWAHLIFTLFIFFLMPIFITVSTFVIYYHYNGERMGSFVGIMNRIQYYSFWASLIIGHIFLIVAIVRSRSHNSAQLPPDDKDLLSELAG